MSQEGGNKAECLQIKQMKSTKEMEDEHKGVKTTTKTLTIKQPKQT